MITFDKPRKLLSSAAQRSSPRAVALLALPIGRAFAFFANNNFVVYSPYWHILKIIQKYFSKGIANSNKGVTFTSTNNDNI